jgi:hypothetical protein
MTYTRRNRVEEQQEAYQEAKQITATYEQLNIALDPIDWQQFGMLAPVNVNNIEIASLQDLSQRSSDDLLRQAQIRMLEHAALRAANAQPGLKALMWTPLEVVQPQDFLRFWIITLETDERIPLVESVKNGQRVYETYTFDETDREQLAQLFGPESEGEYKLHETVTIKERDRQYTGEIIYIIPPGKALPNRTTSPRGRGYHAIAGKTYTDNVASRYVIDCKDGFPHLVNQSQISRDE